MRLKAPVWQQQPPQKGDRVYAFLRTREGPRVAEGVVVGINDKGYEVWFERLPHVDRHHQLPRERVHLTPGPAEAECVVRTLSGE